MLSSFAIIRASRAQLLQRIQPPSTYKLTQLRTYAKMSPDTMNTYLQTLSSITSTKTSIFSRQKALFLQHKSELLSTLKADNKDAIEQLKELIHEMSLPSENSTSDPRQNLFAQMIRKNTTVVDSPSIILKRLKLLLATEESDPAVAGSEEVLAEWIGMLEGVLAQQERRMEVAGLVGRMVGEWLSSRGNFGKEYTSEGGANSATAEMKKEQLEMFRSLVFTPHPLDSAGPGVQENKVREALDALFQATPRAKKVLNHLRSSLRMRSNDLPRACSGYSLGEDYIPRLVVSLVNSDIFRNEKKSFLEDQVLPNAKICQEIHDVMNLWAADLGNWTWESAGLGIGAGVKLQPRFHINGKYRVYMDLDPTVALFAHHIGTWLSMKMKQDLSVVFDKRLGAWKGGHGAPMKNMSLKRNLSRCTDQTSDDDDKSIEHIRRENQRELFFLSNLQDQLPEAEEPGDGGGYDGEGEQEAGFGLNKQEKNANGRNSKSGRLVKERILHTLMTEFHLSRALSTKGGSNEFTVVMSDFKWFGPSLSHETLGAILRYFGFSNDVIAFFKRYLRVPCYFDEESAECIKTRVRGIPLGHPLCDMSAELLLFCLDFLVNQVSGGDVHLYRCFDDLWFWGRDKKKCELVWKEMQKFADTFGLEFNLEKSGSISFSFDGNGDVITPNLVGVSKILPKGPVKWGLLELTSAGTLTPDQEMVQGHINELTRQLSSPRISSSILSFANAWNRYFAAFLPYHFAPPAYALGKSHSQMVLNQLSSIQSAVLKELNGGEGTTLVKFLRKEISRRFPEIDGAKIPDAWFYWPSALGGLGLQNPILKLGSEMVWTIDEAPISDINSLTNFEPNTYLRQKLDIDKYNYELAKTNWIKRRESEEFLTEEEFYSPDAREKFFSFWGQIYSRLLEKPDAQAVLEVVTGSDLERAVDLVGMERFWNGEYGKRLLAVYGHGVVKTWGGLRLVEKEWVPGGLLEGARQEQGGWEE
ncbi:hypothetical protein L211DRAFT_897316 [Terfezia boudieri ATCC MYA-4762]|uniref:Reverse transcriptase domain-containing protein n=1 Tax=Terfezia boudieri ATCC MYA-4762 TaxID=1051890 RepID=A0A3N4LWL6_9PEZI|nr:hypothetical protein L211DRAFT_897316 [Terfezia boudieri ATCC MYA-4762]